jgi:dihydroorotase
MPQLSLEKLVHLFSTAPRRLFELKYPAIQVNQHASLSLFLPNQEWTPESFYSKSKNSAFIGKRLTGKPLGIINKDKVFLTT